MFVLTADSLQYEYFADALSRIAELTDGVEFTNAVSTAPQTASSMPTLAAGVYHDETPGRGLPESGSPTPLAEVLAEAGYTCGLWTDNTLFGAAYNYDRGFEAGNLGRPSWKKRVANAVRSGPLSPAFELLEWGYFNVYEPVADRVGSETGFYRPAGDLNRAALDWLATTDGRRLCWIHYMDTHHPYQPPTTYLADRSLNGDRSRSELGQFTRDVVKRNGAGATDDALEDVVTAYDACCEYLADETVAFVERLLERGHFDPERDVLVFTADHGECLTPEPYGMMGHLPAAFWEDIVHVPLLIARPDWSRETVDDQVSLIDLLPTVLSALGAPIPDGVSGRAASRPAEMGREYAYGLSEPYSPDGDGYTYRSVREESGRKLFGADRFDRNEVIVTGFSPKAVSSERIRHATTDWESATDRGDSEDWVELLGALDGIGPPVEPRDRDAETTARGSEALERHLHDLGYID